MKAQDDLWLWRTRSSARGTMLPRLQAKDWFVIVVALGMIFFSTISLIRAGPLLVHEPTRWIGLFIVGIAGALFIIGVMMLYQMRSELILDQIFNTVNDIQKKMKKEL